MATNKIPLALDIDGTFLKTDMLLENFWSALGKEPLATLKSSIMLFGNRPLLKARLAELGPLRVDLLPVNDAVVALANEAQEEGRDVVFASASTEVQVQALADEYGLGAKIFASDSATNLKGEAKAQALVAAYGEAGFDYAGNDVSDGLIWEHANRSIAIGSVKVPDEAKTTRLAGGWTFRDLMRGLRPHQWVKNILLVLPVIAAHDFTLASLGLVLLGMAAFSAAASCIYIVNDLLDLEADRLHPTKCKRPFASGAVPIAVGMAACLACAVVALGVGTLLGSGFLLVVCLYMALSLAYSLRLKRMRWVDIATLASLYTLRVVAGAAASKVDASVYMLVFIFPVFLTLGCVKRLTELTLATSDERLPGRGYSRLDREDLLNVSGLGMAGALVVFFMYSISDQGRALYPTTWILWLALFPIAWWLLRMIRLGWMGKQDYDPIVFAMRDKRGIGLLLITLSLMFTARPRLGFTPIWPDCGTVWAVLACM